MRTSSPSAPPAADALWRPYTQHALAGAPLPVARAEGAWLVLEDGRRILDAVSSWWVNLHGHSHPRIAEAIARQARELEHVIFAGFTHRPAEELARGLLAAAPAGLSRVFLSDDGSTAVEAALKMALGFWAARGERRLRIAAFENAYHGDTFGAMAASARGAFTASYEPLLFSVERIPAPEPGRERASLAALERAAAGGLAALIVEPLVQGAGGMRMHEPAALAALREACARAGALFIADEVMTGFGRTGTMFACEQAGISPDILCLSKGITGGFLPLGATLATEEVFSAFYSEDRARAFFHGHSYTGNPLSCAAAAANLALFAEEPVMERVARVAAWHRPRLERLAGRPGVAATRQRGTIAVVELQARDAGYLSALAPRLHDFYLSRGVLLRPLGNVVYLMPPYCVTEDELDLAYAAVEDSLALLAA